MGWKREREAITPFNLKTEDNRFLLFPYAKYDNASVILFHSEAFNVLLDLNRQNCPAQLQWGKEHGIVNTYDYKWVSIYLRNDDQIGVVFSRDS